MTRYHPVRRDRSLCANFGHADAELRTLDGRAVRMCRRCGGIDHAEEGAALPARVRLVPYPDDFPCEWLVMDGGDILDTFGLFTAAERFLRKRGYRKTAERNCEGIWEREEESD